MFISSGWLEKQAVRTHILHFKQNIETAKFKAPLKKTNEL